MGMTKIESIRKRPYLAIMIIFILLLCMSQVVPDVWIDPFIRIMIYILLGMSTNILVGYIGMMPMGQALFVGIIAYTYSILMGKLNVAIVPAIFLSLLVSVAASVFVGYFCLRGGEGFAVGFIFMGFNTLFSLICNKVQYLGFEAGLTGAERFVFMETNAEFLPFVILVVGICYLLIYRLLHSPAALVMKGIRDNPERVTYMGVNIFNFRLLVFVISTFFTAIAGLLYSMYLRGAYPNMASNNFSVQLLMMCIVGGMYHFTGPTWGAIFICLVFSRLSNYTIYWQSIVGILLVLSVLFMDGGFMGFFDKIKIRMKLKKQKNNVKITAKVQLINVNR